MKHRIIAVMAAIAVAGAVMLPGCGLDKTPNPGPAVAEVNAAGGRWGVEEVDVNGRLVSCVTFWGHGARSPAISCEW